jgi:hypothetical protein
MSKAKTSKAMEFATEWVGEFQALLHTLRLARKRELVATAKLLRAGYASVQFGDNQFWNDHGPREVEGLDEADALLFLADIAGTYANLDTSVLEETGEEFPPLED